MARIILVVARFALTPTCFARRISLGLEGGRDGGREGGREGGTEGGREG